MGGGRRATETLLEVTGLRHCYGDRPVLDIPRFSLLRGEIFCLLGPSGSGKSTLLRLLNALEAPAQGAITWRGERFDLPRLPSAMRRRMTLLFQEPQLFRGTVAYNVAMGLRLRGRPAGEVEERVKAILARFHLEDKASRPVTRLSGGEVQRVCLARAFVMEPELVLVDEPFNHLDAPLRAELLHSVCDFIKGSGITALFVTHSRDEALAVADRMGILMGGTLRSTGAPQELFHAPGDVEVADFLGIENIFEGVVESAVDGVTVVRSDSGALLQVASFEERYGAGDRLYVLIRPERISLAPAGEPSSPTSARNRFTGTVQTMRSAGHNVLVTVDCGFPLKSLVTTLSCREMGLEPGEAVIASFKATGASLVRH